MLQRYLGRMRSSQFQPGQSGLDGGLLAVWRISSKGSTPNRGRPAANQQISTEPQQGGRKSPDRKRRSSLPPPQNTPPGRYLMAPRVLTQLLAWIYNP